VVDGVALNITVQSYDGSLFVGINASATVTDDVPSLAIAMVEELKVLMQAASEMDERPTLGLVERSPEERARFMTHRTMGAAAMSRYVPRGAQPTAHAVAPTIIERRQTWRIDKETSWD
jgi:hypothetical protein